MKVWSLNGVPVVAGRWVKRGVGESFLFRVIDAHLRFVNTSQVVFMLLILLSAFKRPILGGCRLS